MAIKNIIKKVKNKVIDVASDAMSYPARSKAKKEIAKSNAITNDIKLVNQAKGTQDGGDYRDPLFRARANVAVFKVEQEQKNKRIQIAKKVNRNPSNYETDYAKMRSSANR